MLSRAIRRVGWIALSGALCIALITTFVGRDAAAESWNLYIHQSAPQFTTSLGSQKLADGITAASGGALEVRRHLVGTLQIKASDITQAVGQNIVQMGDDLFFSGNVPIGALLRLPFLIQTYDEYKTAEALVMPYIEKAYAQAGVVVLGGYLYPLQYVWARGEIDSLDDIKGMKVRVSSPEQGAFVDRLGGNPVTMGASEVPSALDRGVVDGLVTGSVGADLWQDLLKSGFLIGLSFNNSYIIANAQAFNALAPDVQATVREQVAQAANWNQDTMREDDGKIIDRLKADASFAVAEPSAEERKRAADALAPYWVEWAEQRGPEALEALAKVREALGR